MYCRIWVQSARLTRVEDGADFALAGVGHFVVMHFDRHAQGASRVSTMAERMSLQAVDRGTGK